MIYLQSFFKYLEFEKRCSRHTLTAYKCDLNQFSEFIIVRNGNDDPCRVSTKDIRTWVVELVDNGATPKTVHRKVTTLRSFFKFLNREEVLETNPADKVITPKIPKKLPVFVKEEQMDLLLDEVDFGVDFKGVRSRMIIDLFYNTGIRLSELINLRDTDLDFAGGLLKVLGKGNKERLVPITKKLIVQIEKYIAARNSFFGSNREPFLFVTGKGKQIYEKLVYRTVKKHLQLVTTLQKKSPHVLRHTFATVLLNKGADINAIKELLGHANLAATEVYTHNTFEQLTAIYKQAHPRV